MKPTRRGVVSDLKMTPYITKIDYGSCVVEYHFSSSLYKSKFDIDIALNRENINNSLSNRFKFDIEMNLLCDIKLYSIIEKRGFFIVCDNEEIICLNNIKLNGRKVIMKN